MTVSSTVRRAGPFLGDGTQTVFPFEFKVLNSDDLMVFATPSGSPLGAAVSELTSGFDYTVSLNNNQDVSPGGSIKLTIPLYPDVKLAIISGRNYLQQVDLTNLGGFFPQVINQGFDSAVIQIQQLAEIAERTIKVPVTDSRSADVYWEESLNWIEGAKNSTAADAANVDMQAGFVSSQVAAATPTVSRFSGNSVTTNFILPSSPGSKNNTQVYINGVYQKKDTYDVSGSTLAFSIPPPTGTENIEVVISPSVQLLIGAADNIAYQEPAEYGGALTSTSAALNNLYQNKTDWVSQFGSSVANVFYRPGRNYENKGATSSLETRPWYHDYRPDITLAGGFSLWNTDGCNMFFGPGAGNFTMRPLPTAELPPGVDDNLQCSHNQGFGLQSLGKLTIGYKNVGFGTNTWRKLTSGHGNSAVGRDAGHEMTTGNDNSFFGFTAGQLMVTGNYNTVAGVSASYTNTAGSANTVMGRRAAFNQSSGDYNQFFGEQAGLGFLDGDYNTFIGKQAAVSGYATGNSSLIIGSRVSGLQNENAQVIFADGAGAKFLEIHKDSVPTIKKASYLELPSRDITPFDPAATDGQINAGSSIILRNLGNSGTAVAQLVFNSRINQAYSRIVSTGGDAAQMAFINANLERLRINNIGHIVPGADAIQNLGSSVLRFATIYASTGAINTSDAEEKYIHGPISEALLDAWGSVSPKVYQWLSAIEEKGSDLARLHITPIAQDVRDALIAAGLMEAGATSCQNGLLCYDEWGDEYRTIPAIYVDHPEKYAEITTYDGKLDYLVDVNGAPLVMAPAWREEIEPEKTELARSAGHSWGLRPDQCLWVEVAYQRRRMDRLEARVAALGTV